MLRRMSNHRSLFERVERANDALTDSQRQIAAYLLRNSHKSAFASAAEIARHVGVSESTVVRFARALGFRGFPDMQSYVQEALLESLSPPQRLELTDERHKGALVESVGELEADNLRLAVESVDSITLSTLSERLWSASRRFIVGVRSSRGPATILAHYLAKIMPSTIGLLTTDAINEAMPWLQESDALVAFSFPRYSLPTVQALRHARDAGAWTAVITDSLLAPPAQLADSTLLAPASSTFFSNSFVAAVAICDLLVTQCVRTQPDAALENLRRAEPLTASREEFYAQRPSRYSR